MAISGECFCGAVKYSISGPLTDARSCHCSRCRKAFSSQASAYALVDPQQFQWISGEGLLTSYMSAHGYGLQICKTCGSTLYTVYIYQALHVSHVRLNVSRDLTLGSPLMLCSKETWKAMPVVVPLMLAVQYVYATTGQAFP